MLPHTIYPSGDQALTISFGEQIHSDLNDHCIRFAAHIKQQQLKSIKEVIAAYCSVTVIYDMFQLREHTSPQSFMQQQLEQQLQHFDPGSVAASPRKIKIPVCYDPSLAPDLEAVTLQKNISIDQFIQLHTSITYKVYMLGFLPGFAYLGKLDPQLFSNRRSTPHLNVAAGSVGIAGEQTGIYPLDSPGGWNIIGRTPLKMFDPNDMALTYLHQGDEVTFYSIDLQTFKQMQP